MRRFLSAAVMRATPGFPSMTEITSRDAGVSDLLYDLERREMPPGIQSWQLPFAFGGGGSVFFFLTVAQPGAIVPSHKHTRDLFRIVVSGSIITNGIELKSGDWMFVPKGVSYSYHAGLNPGAVTYHCYTPTPGPGPKL